MTPAKTATTRFGYHTYSNGLRLITVPMKSTKTVNVLVLVGTGSRYETKEINGISHFLEHMMFKGTAKRPGTWEISQELDSIGAEYNAFTTREFTGYYIKAAKDKFGLVLDVIADIFQNPKLDEAEIEKEKGVIVEEINMYFDKPTRHVQDIYEELLYGDHPLGWNIAGDKETVTSFKRNQFVNYFDSHYFAGNTVVAISGNIEPEEVRAEVKNKFKDTRKHKKLSFQPAREQQSEPGLKILNKKTDQSHFVLGSRAYDMFDPKMEILDIITVILGGSMSSRLFIELRDKRGLTYIINSSFSAFLDSGHFNTQVGVNNKRLIEAIQVVMDEYKRLVDEPVPAKELKKAKDYIRGKTAIELESSDEVAIFYAEQELLKNELETPEQKLAKIDKVTVEDIQSVAKEIFVPNKLNLALIGPAENRAEEIKKVLNSW